MDDVTPLRDALLEDMEADGIVLVDHEGFVARLDALIASAEQRGRDQWLHATAHGTRQWEGLLAKYDLAEDADASSLIAAVETRAARRALEGSGVVEALRGLVVSWSAKAASLRLTRSERHIGQAIGFANAAFDLDQALAALPRPEEPRVERCAFVWKSGTPCGKPKRDSRHKHDSSCLTGGEGHITDMLCHPYTPEAR